MAFCFTARDSQRGAVAITLAGLLLALVLVADRAGSEPLLTLLGIAAIIVRAGSAVALVAADTDATIASLQAVLMRVGTAGVVPAILAHTAFLAGVTDKAGATLREGRAVLVVEAFDGFAQAAVDAIPYFALLTTFHTVQGGGALAEVTLVGFREAAPSS